jgi:hypothetical protein
LNSLALWQATGASENASLTSGYLDPVLQHHQRATWIMVLTKIQHGILTRIGHQALNLIQNSNIKRILSGLKIYTMINLYLYLIGIGLRTTVYVRNLYVINKCASTNSRRSNNFLRLQRFNNSNLLFLVWQGNGMH